MAMPIDPLTLSLPIMKAIFGSWVPSKIALNVSIDVTNVVSASASSSEMTGGFCVASTKTMPSSPKSNLSFAFKLDASAIFCLIFAMIASLDMVCDPRLLIVSSLRVEEDFD